jgi:hypothetical protein
MDDPQGDTLECWFWDSRLKKTSVKDSAALRGRIFPFGRSSAEIAESASARAR